MSQSIHEMGLEPSNFHIQDSTNAGPVHLSDKHTTLDIPTSKYYQYPHSRRGPLKNRRLSAPS